MNLSEYTEHVTANIKEALDDDSYGYADMDYGDVAHHIIDIDDVVGVSDNPETDARDLAFDENFHTALDDYGEDMGLFLEGPARVDRFARLVVYNRLALDGDLKSMWLNARREHGASGVVK